MNPSQIRRARRLLDDIERLDHQPKVFPLIRELRALLEPPPTLREIFDMVPGDTIEAKAQAVGISRSLYYKTINGEHRPRDGTVRLLATVSGLPIETVRAACP